MPCARSSDCAIPKFWGNKAYHVCMARRQQHESMSRPRDGIHRLCHGEDHQAALRTVNLASRSAFVVTKGRLIFSPPIFHPKLSIGEIRANGSTEVTGIGRTGISGKGERVRYGVISPLSSRDERVAYGAPPRSDWPPSRSRNTGYPL